MEAGFPCLGSVAVLPLLRVEERVCRWLYKWPQLHHCPLSFRKPHKNGLDSQHACYVSAFFAEESLKVDHFCSGFRHTEVVGILERECATHHTLCVAMQCSLGPEFCGSLKAKMKVIVHHLSFLSGTKAKSFLAVAVCSCRRDDIILWGRFHLCPFWVCWRAQPALGGKETHTHGTGPAFVY